MARWRKPAKDELPELRRVLMERAHHGTLQLPGAAVAMRKSFGMTQDEFARLIGLTRRQIAEIETGVANPTLETLQKIGKLFGFTVGFVPKTQRTDEGRGSDLGRNDTPGNDG